MHLLKAFFIGGLTLLGQLMLIRELAIVFRGTEIFLGLSLAFWLAGSALGASSAFNYISSRSKLIIKNSDHFGAGAFALFLPLSILLCRSTASLLSYKFGPSPGFITMFLMSCLYMLPLAMTGGLWFAGLLAATERNKPKHYNPGLLFGAETLGATFFGLTYTFGLAYYWKPFLYATLISGSILFILFLKKQLPYHRLLQALVVVLILACSVSMNYFEKKIHVPLTDRRYTQTDSFFTLKGHVSIQHFNGIKYFYNGKPLPAPKILQNLELHSFLLNYFGHMPKQIALFGSASLHWQFFHTKHPQTMIFPFFDDKQAVEKTIGLKNITNLENVHAVFQDHRYALKQQARLYDSVLLNLDLPFSLASNRLFTIDFLKLLKKNLTNEGVVIYVLPYNTNRQDPSERRMLQSLWQGFKKVYPQHMLLAGDHLIFIGCSTDSLPLFFNDSKRRPLLITNQVLTSGNLDNIIDQNRTNALHHQLSRSPFSLNHDNHPVLLSWASLYWMTQQNGHWGLGLPILLILLCAWWMKKQFLLKPSWLLLLLIGFSGMTSELLLLTIFQSLRGNLWHEMGLLFASFMAGSAVGSYLFHARPLTLIRLRLLLIGTISLLIIAPTMLIAAQGHPLIAALGIFTSGLFVGAFYASVTVAKTHHFASMSWSADLIGSMLAGLLIPVLFFPLLGVMCIIIPVGLLFFFLLFHRKGVV